MTSDALVSMLQTHFPYFRLPLLKKENRGFVHKRRQVLPFLIKTVTLLNHIDMKKMGKPVWNVTNIDSCLITANVIFFKLSSYAEQSYILSNEYRIEGHSCQQS
jgi:hypothetical protein